MNSAATVWPLFNSLQAFWPGLQVCLAYYCKQSIALLYLFLSDQLMLLDGRFLQEILTQLSVPMLPSLVFGKSMVIPLRASI
jgi:hypothetical protein